MNVRMLALLIAACGLAGGFTRGLAGTLPNQDQNQGQRTVEPTDKTPVFRVNVESRSTKAVDYRHRGGSTKVDLRGTDLMPRAGGEARVESKTGRLEINAKLNSLEPANKFGLEYLTYVLWAVTPEGRANNLGEIVLSDGKSEIRVTEVPLADHLAKWSFTIPDEKGVRGERLFWESRLAAGKTGGRKGKGCALVTLQPSAPAREPTAWMHAPSQPLMRSLLSQFQTPTAPRRTSRFFRVWLLVRSPC
jgi:hypothetical protein